MTIEFAIGGRPAVSADVSGVKIVPTPGRLQEKSVNPTESSQNITPDADYQALSQVNVGAIPSDYVGSAITRDPELSVSGKDVTAPAGYYSEAQTESVADGTLANPTISVSGGGLITAQASISAAGYLAANTSKSATQQLATQAGKTVTPTNAEQIAVEAGKYVTGDIKVAPQSSGPDTSDATATASDIAYGKTAYIADGSKATGNVTERDFSDLAVLTPTALGGGVSAPAGIYRSAATKRDAQLVAANVRYGKTVLGVQGTFTQISSGAAAAGDVLSGKKAYVNGSEITGTLVVPTLHIDTKTATLASASQSMSFTGLSAEPEFFAVQAQQSAAKRITSVVYDGTTIEGIYDGSPYSSLSWSYSNGTLTITATNNFAAISYKLVYGYTA